MKRLQPLSPMTRKLSPVIILHLLGTLCRQLYAKSQKPRVIANTDGEVSDPINI
ncbi:MAG: hypothetical protein H7A55_03705 [Verrucomicrobiaceae bacterium]|nr:hypothetical protein [Verrucomicrobiaceae bacterium]